MAKINLLSLLDICLLVLLVGLNLLLLFNNNELIVRLEPFRSNIDITSVIIAGVIFSTLFGFIINYNILKVLFNLSVDTLDWQEVFFIYICSSLFATVLTNLLKLFFVMNYFGTAILLNCLYGFWIVLLSNIFVWRKKTKMHIKQHLVRRLNVMLIIYAILNVVIVTLGTSINV
jgi:hypothetical protein